MVVRKLNSGMDGGRPSVEDMSAFFHRCIDGLGVGKDSRKDFALLERTAGIVIVSPEHGILDGKPVSELERRLEMHFGGPAANSNDTVFTVQKDGFQALVFEHSGQYFCSDWFLDTVSGKDIVFVDVNVVRGKSKDLVREGSLSRFGKDSRRNVGASDGMKKSGVKLLSR